MNLDEIVAKVATDTGVSRGDVKKAIEGVFAAIKSAVDAGNKIHIPGMGAFQLKKREAGQKVDKSGRTRDVTAARFVTFRPSRTAMGLPPKKDRTEKRGKKKAGASETSA